MRTDNELREEIAALRAELHELRAHVRRVDGGGSSAPSADREPESAVSSRRHLLRLAAAGAGGLGVAQVVGAAPAAADNGQALVLGSDVNTATAPTGLSVQGNQARYGLGATDNGASDVLLPSALFGHARGFISSNFSTGVLGVAEESAFYGVVGQSVRCGVNGIATGPADNGWPGVLGQGRNGVGVRGEGGTHGVVGTGDAGGVLGEGRSRPVPALRAGGQSGLVALNPAQPAPPTAGTYRRGDILNDRNDSGVWVCVTGGAPGVWRKVAGPATAGAFHPIDGIRAYDSRQTGGRLNGGQTRTVTVPTTAAPGGATAVHYVLTVLSTAGSGRLVAYRADGTRPAITSLSWFGGSQQLSVGLVTALSPARQLKVFASAGSTHFTVDVLGYYR